LHGSFDTESTDFRVRGAELFAKRILQRHATEGTAVSNVWRRGWTWFVARGVRTFRWGR
jgi:hypothetical protein